MKEYEIETMLDPVKNFGKATVSTGYSNIDTVIVLTTDDGAKLPNPSTDGPFNLVWWNSTDHIDPSDDPNREIVRVTERTGDALTITRAQEGTGMVPNIQGNPHNITGKIYKMILALTAKMIPDIQSDAQTRANTAASAAVTIHRTTDVHTLAQSPISHGNEAHTVTFAASADINTRVESHRTTEVHTLAQPPISHGNEAHTVTFATLADINTRVESHRTTEVHTLAQPSSLITLGLWGDGADGDVTISSGTTLSNNMNYNNLTVNSGVSLGTAGYIVRVMGTLTINGTIYNDGNGGSGGSPGTGLSDVVLKGSGSGGTGGAAGSPGWAGVSTVGFGGNGGNAGSGGSGAGAGGICTQNKTFTLVELGHLQSLSNRIIGGAGGGGGSSNCSSNQGGGGGGGGGAMLIFAKIIQVNGSGIIRSKGGNGGSSVCSAGTGGGGGGGGGGYMYIVYGSLTNNGLISAPGGIGGSGTGGGGTGSDGQSGKVVLLQV